MRFLLVITGFLVLQSCGSLLYQNDKPAVTKQQSEIDLKECRAEQDASTKEVVKGAVVGGVVAGPVGAIAGIVVVKKLASDKAAQDIGLAGDEAKDELLRNCLAERGYSVID